MEDKTKLYVFAKKEVFLIFVFMILISITSFLLGVKIGVNNSFEKSGYSKEDVNKVEILSPAEEKVNEIEKSVNSDDETYKALKEKTDMALEKKVEQEFSGTATNSDSTMNTDVTSPTSSEVSEVPQMEAPKESSRDKLSGKYTIQVGSFPSVDEAEVFAKGFKARGYTTIINEKNLQHKGTWFRVSIGVFENISEAKDYVIEHKSLFSSSEYRFTQFD
ncbi:putative membrane protein [Halobacteriovorax marinus SJ]|uniref:Membrane protein n=1 Tax=Halobacteriovorax marinus (strain ATCC BAA-682 / DSM 15412 / SJ) TaxID=862908 RepID=E1X5L0_HALMS|nr:SPOR domain-containing protein [Halobacteriovorax marinus]CBW27331.1 putative membrane protein [Halobacteriovorax marinus SJ]